jgi:hypothetical protein
VAELKSLDATLAVTDAASTSTLLHLAFML